MKKLLALALILVISACAADTAKDAYPYGMTEREWNDLSAKDKVKIRRDFYFYEKGNTNFVNPDIEVEGKKEVSHFTQPRKAVQKTVPASTPDMQ